MPKRVTNQDILDIYTQHMQVEEPLLHEMHESVITLNAHMEAVTSRLEEHHKAINGNGTPGMKAQLVALETSIRSSVNTIKVVAGVMATITSLALGVAGFLLNAAGLVSCAPHMSPPQATAAAYNATYAAGTATARAVPTPEYDPTLMPTATEAPRPTPTGSIVIVTPRPSTTPVDHIIEVDTQEVEWLSALCWIEGRGYGKHRAALCASAISTVFERTRRRELSSGTVYSTLTWDCRPDSKTCQFPAWAVFGCDGILPSVCPDNDPDGLLYFQGVVLGYLADTIKPQCDSYLYYDNSPAKDTPCIIKGPNGQQEGFYNK